MVKKELVQLVDFERDIFDKTRIWLKDEELRELIQAVELNDKESLCWFNSLKVRNDYYIQGVVYSDIPIGVVGLKHIDLENKVAEYWGYIGIKEYWGKGIGEIMIDGMIERGKKMNISTLRLNVISNNKRAIRLYEKKGFISIEEKNNVIKMKKIITMKG